MKQKNHPADWMQIKGGDAASVAIAFAAFVTSIQSAIINHQQATEL